MSRFLHSSTECFGSPNSCSPNSTIRLFEVFSIGDMLWNASSSPSVMNFLNESV